MQNKILYIIIILLALIPMVGATPINWTIESNTSFQIDVINSTYLQPFMYYLMISNDTPIWEFPVIGMLQGITGIFYDTFEQFAQGSLLYLVLWGMFILLAWRNANSVSIPALAAVITAGGWSLLLPQDSQPWTTILLCCGIAALLISLFSQED